MGYKTKTTNEQAEQTHRYRQHKGAHQRGRGLGEEQEGKEGQIYVDGRRLDFGW